MTNLRCPIMPCSFEFDENDFAVFEHHVILNHTLDSTLRRFLQIYRIYKRKQ